MKQAGKPLRFLGAVIGGWILLRLGAVAMPLLWETGDDIAVASAETSGARESAAVPSHTMDSTSEVNPLASHPFVMSYPAHHVHRGTNPPVEVLFAEPAPQPVGSRPLPNPVAVTRALGTPPGPAAGNSTTASVPAPLPDVPPAPRASPWSLTAWALWRRDGGAGLAQAPLLGGSQAGLRLDYRLWGAGNRSFGLYGRVTRALERPFAEEAALGITLRPIEGVPVALLAERRQRLGAGGRSGFAFMAAGGIGPKDIAPRLAVEGYAQAGAVIAPGSDGFADGRLSIDYRLTRKTSQPDLAIGVVASGGAQTGASRLDIGPEVRLRLPVAGGHLRLSAEWRERIAGKARPASGPAVTLVADF